MTIFQGDNGITKTLSYGYRDNGQLVSFTYPNNASVMYGYDSAGNLASVKAHEQTANFTHHWQQLRKVTFPNAEKSYAYDAIGRLSGITLKSGNQTLQNDQYAYDLVGNIEKLERVEGTYRYAYDVMDRLIKATPPENISLPTEQYTYDAVHNRLTSHEAGLFEYNANHALVRRGSLAAPVTYDYDANGNVLNQTHTSPAKTLSYRYDGRDRLTEVNSQPAGTKASYVYDPFGRRIQKTVNGTTILYFYNDQGLIGEYTADGIL